MIMKRMKIEHNGQLLEYLIENVPEASRTTLKSYLSHRQILVNGKLATVFDYHLNKGDELQILDKGVEKQNPNSRMRIIFEDKYIIVIDKRNGLLTMSTGKEGEQTAYSQLMEHVRRHTGDKAARIFIVHRLDRETSGLLIFAKSEEVQHILQEKWEENVITRQYVAVVEGKMEKSEGQIVSWLTENSKSFKMHSSPTDNGGKKAITNYKVIKSNGNYTLLYLWLETGRKNQIRVQMASIGHPVAGDKRYGAHSNPINRLCLHANLIAFVHPMTGERMKFDTGIPQIFQ